jgi:hypothetical protein
MEGSYSHPSRINRLVYAARIVSDSHPDEALNLLQRAIQLIKLHTYNTELYETVNKDAQKVIRHAVEKGAMLDVDLSEFEDDTNWLKNANLAFADHMEKLTTDLEVRKR